MTVNLLEEANSFLTHDVVEQISKQLGETEQHTQAALKGALPLLLGGLIHKSSQPGGTSSVMDLVAEVTTPARSIDEVVEPVGGIPGQLSHLLSSSGDQLSHLLATGSSIVASLFGDRAGAVTSALGNYSGLKHSSATTLLHLTGPVLLSVLGQRKVAEDISLSGMTSLLNDQTPYVQAAIPSGLASLLGNLSGSSTRSSLSAEPVVENRTVPNQPRSEQSTPSANSAAYDEVNATDGGNRWLPWLLLVLGALALFFILRSCGNDSETATTSGTILADSANVVSDANTKLGTAIGNASTASGPAADATSEATSNLGALTRRTLPSGVELNVPENGIESQLVAFIADQNRPVDKETWFNFNRLVFDTGKASLRPDSKDEVKNIAEVLKAYPNVTIKIGGYTDNTGYAQANQKLSAERATTVLNELVQLGIDPSRLEAEGYGSAHPVASNDTEEGRTQNRRIAVRVTKK